MYEFKSRLEDLEEVRQKEKSLSCPEDPM
jgi:hypothetical protein